LYTRLDHIEEEPLLQKMEQEMTDRVGTMPLPVKNLFMAVRCRHLATQLGFERLMLKKKVLRLYFLSDPASPYFETDKFRHILNFIQTQTNRVVVKQKAKQFFLSMKGIKNMEEALHF